MALLNEHGINVPLSPGKRIAGVNYTHLSNVELKNTWSYTSIGPYIFMAWCLAQDASSLLST